MKHSCASIFVERFAMFFLFVLLFSSLQAAEPPSLEEKNKQADTAFLAWKAPYLSAPLRAVLVPKAKEYLVEAAQLPLDVFLTDKELSRIIEVKAKGFEKQFKMKPAARTELRSLLHQMIIPEYKLFPSERELDKLDKAYNELFKLLANQKTKIGTTLDTWFLGLLSSESILATLSLIKKVSKDFYASTPVEQKKLLNQVAELVLQRFMEQLQAVAQKNKFQLPAFTQQAILRKLEEFLYSKFKK